MIRSFLTQYPILSNEIITPVVMFIDNSKTKEEVIKNTTSLQIDNNNRFTALWDTGAGCSCVKPSVLEKLKLEKKDIITYREVTGVNSQAQQKPVYRINLILPNNVIFPQWNFVESDIATKADILIGMDIISQGNFIIDNSNNTTKFSFSMPPQQIFNFNTTFNNTINNK